MAALLTVSDLRVDFKTHAGIVQAVRGVDLYVARGETLGIVGESGSGKSVSMMSVTRLLPENGRITSGKITFDGKDLLAASKAELKAVRGKRVSMVFQDPMTSLNPLLTVGEQIREMLLLHERGVNLAQSKRRALEMMARVRISDPEKRYYNYPHEFSGGMRQRVMIAMSLMCSPDLVIADEPTTALDVTIQAQILKLLSGLQKDLGMSVIFITHDLGVAASLCTRIMVMYGGLIMEQGATRDIFYAPSHPYTRGLLSSVPRLDQDKSRQLSPIPGSPPDMLGPPSGCPFAPRCQHARVVCHNMLPPLFELSGGQTAHASRCWLLAEGAPAQDNPFYGIDVAGGGAL